MALSPRARKYLRLTVITSLASLALLMTFTLILVLLARSPAVRERAATYARGPMKSLGIELSFDAFRVDPRQEVTIRNLRLTLSRPLPARGTINLATLEMRFSLALWSRHLTMTSFRLSGLHADLDIDLPPPAPPPPEKPPFDFVAFLKNPPATFDIARATVSDIRVNARLHSPTLNTEIRLASLELDARAALAPNHLTGEYKASTRGQLSLDLGVPKNATHAQTSWAVSDHGSFDIAARANSLGTVRNQLKATLTNTRLSRGPRELLSLADVRADVLSTLAQTSANNTLTLTINTLPILSAESAVSSLQQNTRARSRTRLTLSPRLAETIPQAAILQKLGTLDFSLDQEASLKNPRPLWEKESLAPDALDISISGGFEAAQREAPKAALARWERLGGGFTLALQRQNLQGEILLSLRNLAAQGLARPLNLEQKITLGGSTKIPSRLSLNAQTHLNTLPVLSWEGLLLQDPTLLTLTGKLNARVPPALKSLVPALAILERLGTPNLTLDHRLLLKTLPKAPSDITANINGQITLESPPSSPAPLASLEKALHFQAKAHLAGTEAEASLAADLPSTKVADLLRVNNLDVSALVRVPDTTTLNPVTASVRASIASFKILKDIPERAALERLLRGAELDLIAALEGPSRAALTRISASLAKPFITFEGSGASVLPPGPGDFKGLLTARFPGPLPGGIELKGGIDIPVHLTWLDVKRVSANLETSLREIDITHPKLQIAGLRGKIPVREDLTLLAGPAIAFQYLESHNPFTRADYDAMEPYLAERDMVRIERVQSGDVVLGPMVAAVNVRQNLMLLDDARASLLGGNALGRVFVDLTPDQPMLGVLARYTEIEPQLLLSKKFRGPRDRDAIVSGRTALTFDIRKRLASGRVDVTRIGRDQLLSLLDLIDPKREDPQIGAARKALYLAAPRKVTVTMEQGTFDLDVQMSGAAPSIAIRSLPLTPLIIAFADAPLAQLDQRLGHANDATSGDTL